MSDHSVPKLLDDPPLRLCSSSTVGLTKLMVVIIGKRHNAISGTERILNLPTLEVLMFTTPSFMSFSSFVRSGVSKLSDMDIPSRYCFILGCIFAIWLFLRAVYRTLTSEWLSTSSFFLKHAAYPHVFPRIPFVGTATRLEVLLASAYLTTNIVLVTVVGVDSRSDIGTRAAIMSMINLIPLLCGPRLSLMTEMLGITLRTSIGSHQWLGRTAVAEVLLHTIISLTGSQSFVWTGINASGVVVRLRWLSHRGIYG